MSEIYSNPATMQSLEATNVLFDFAYKLTNWNSTTKVAEPMLGQYGEDYFKFSAKHKSISAPGAAPIFTSLTSYNCSLIY